MWGNRVYIAFDKKMCHMSSKFENTCQARKVGQVDWAEYYMFSFITISAHELKQQKGLPKKGLHIKALLGRLYEFGS